jgi:hypothetical protein
MQYDFYEWRWLGDVVGYEEIIRHDYKEGGAEYLQIINQSTDKEVEFFFAGGQDLPETIEEFNTVNIGYFEKTLSIPSVQYEKAPVQYLFFPDCKPKYNIVNIGILYTFEGSSCGDITITDPWTVDAVNELYRAEYNRFNEIKLFGDDPTEKWRLIDAAKEGGKFFWGSIKPGECIEGSDKIWLLATPIIFIDSDYYKN